MEVRRARLLRRSHVEGLLKGLLVEGLRLERLLLEGLLLAGLRWAPALWLAVLLLVGGKQASQRLAVLVERLRKLLVEAEYLVLQVLERLRQGRKLLLLLLLMLLRLHQGCVG
jgi:hypothetical protein